MMTLKPSSFPWRWKLYPDDLQKAFSKNFTGILTHPSTRIELRGCKQTKGESFRKYYRCFGELWAQVHDITEREVIEDFSSGILAKWQFQDFYKENP
jgi:hypothetical protein